MTKRAKDGDQPLVCAPHKAPGKPKAWESPSRDHSAGYKGKYASRGRFEAETKGR